MKSRSVLRGWCRRADGQSMLEFAIVAPLLVILGLGLVELSSALLDQHVVTRLTREGSNLISRDTTLGDAATALRSMATRPVDFNSNSTAILSVIMSPSATGTTNYNKPILYQRLQFGAISASSVLSTRGSGAYGGAPDYQATNPNGDSGLQITNLPANLTVPLGGFLYVTEIYTQHPLMTPLQRFGITVPSTLYSVAYF